MALSGPEIIRQRELGNIEVDPFDPANVGINSIDLHMGDTLLRYRRHQNREWADMAAWSAQNQKFYQRGDVQAHYAEGPWATGRLRVIDPCTGGTWNDVIDSRNPPETEEVPRLKNGGWLLTPDTLYLAATLELTRTRGFVPWIDGRSSLGRLGVFCHATAGRGDNGFHGRWTLELSCVEPVVLYPGGRYFQVTFMPVVGEQTFYEGRYQGDLGPVASRIHLPKPGPR